jgi:hypothetical protein
MPTFKSFTGGEGVWTARLPTGTTYGSLCYDVGNKRHIAIVLHWWYNKKQIEDFTKFDLHFSIQGCEERDHKGWAELGSYFEYDLGSHKMKDIMAWAETLFYTGAIDAYV